MHENTGVLIRYDCPTCEAGVGIAQRDGMMPLRIRCLCGQELEPYSGGTTSRITDDVTTRDRITSL